MKLSTYIEQISDDFQSTFTLVDENTLQNMLGSEDKENITKIIQKYLPNAKVSYVKNNWFESDYDCYVINVVY